MKNLRRPARYERFFLPAQTTDAIFSKTVASPERSENHSFAVRLAQPITVTTKQTKLKKVEVISGEIKKFGHFTPPVQFPLGKQTTVFGNVRANDFFKNKFLCHKNDSF